MDLFKRGGRKDLFLLFLPYIVGKYPSGESEMCMALQISQRMSSGKKAARASVDQALWAEDTNITSERLYRATLSLRCHVEL